MEGTDKPASRQHSRLEWMTGIGALFLGLGALTTPLLVSRMTASITKSNGEGEIGVRMIEVAVDLLKQSPDSLGRDHDTKEWARKVVNSYSRVPLPENALLTGPALRVVGPDRVINFSLAPDSVIAEVNLFQDPNKPVNQWDATSACPAMLMTVLGDNADPQHIKGHYVPGDLHRARFILPREVLGKKLRIVMEMGYAEKRPSGWPVQEISGCWCGDPSSLHVEVNLESGVLVTRRW